MAGAFIVPIRGSRSPSACFLCEREGAADWFVLINNTGGAVDVWAVDGVTAGELIEDPTTGYTYIPRTVARVHVRLVRSDIHEQSL